MVALFHGPAGIVDGRSAGRTLAQALPAGSQPGPANPNHNWMTANKAVLDAATDACGRPFQRVEMHHQPHCRHYGLMVRTFSYTNCYKTSGNVIAPTRRRANRRTPWRSPSSPSFSGPPGGRLPARTLAGDGGGVHCATQHVSADMARRADAPRWCAEHVADVSPCAAVLDRRRLPRSSGGERPGPYSWQVTSLTWSRRRHPVIGYCSGLASAASTAALIPLSASSRPSSTCLRPVSSVCSSTVSHELPASLEETCNRPW